MESAKTDNQLEDGAQSSPDGSARVEREANSCSKCGTPLVGCETFCKACGSRIVEGMGPPAQDVIAPPQVKRFCSTCGAEVHPLAEICPKCGVRLAKTATGNPADISPKSRLTATLLCALLGALLYVFGIHRLYLGKIGSGVTMLVLAILGWLTIWLCGLGLIFWAIAGIWQIVDFILLVSGSMTDGNGKKVTTWTNS